ncbi:sulfatase [Burkholderia cepacia]|nr:sulfatase [Burkholderia cepacia]
MTKTGIEGDKVVKLKIFIFRMMRYCVMPSIALALLFNASLSFAQVVPPPAARTVLPVQKRPNVLVIVVDDLAWPDVSTYGRKTVPTPNIDRIANRGVAFTSGYVAASVCSLSRAGLITGRMPQRFGLQYNIDDDANPDQGVPVTETFLAARLKERGYRTAAIGKWHLGSAPQYYPTKRGFDEFYGFLGGETMYADLDTPGIVTTRTKRGKSYKRGTAGETVTGPDATPVDNHTRYLTEDFTDKAVEYIDRNANGDQPFFLYLAYNAPHWPLQVEQRYYDRFANIDDPVRRTLVAMISELDDGVGRVLDALDNKGIRNDTMIVFVSDNGCPFQFGACDCSHPWGAGKFTYVEGGVRVPFLFSWPNGLHAKGLNDTPVSMLDIVPTVLKATSPNIPLPMALDGQDMIAALDRQPEDPSRTLVWGQAPVYAAREGRWKLWQDVDRHETELYDLETDAGELHDVSAEHPDITSRLAAQIDVWRNQLPPAMWSRRFARQYPVCTKKTTWVY